jgi:PadR family transcriptional regulator PadR
MGMAKPDASPDFLPGTLKMLILKTLTRGPNHGYGVAQHIQQVSEDILKIGEGSLYPALRGS